MNNYDNYIFQIVASGGLTKASDVLGISQPALSLALNKLEKELGFRIFNRRTIPISLTAEGQIYYKYLKRKRLLQEDFTVRVSALREVQNSRVVIGGPEVYVGGLVTVAVKKLLAQHPDFLVDLKSASIGQLIDLAGNREIDCFISTTGNLPSNFEKLPVKREKIYLCIPLANPLNMYLKSYEARPGNSEKRMAYSCLNGAEFIYLEDWQPLQKLLQSFLKQYSVEPVNRIIVNQVSTLLNMAVSTGGLCIASEFALACNNMGDQFCLYLLPETLSDRMLYVAYDKDLFVSKATRELIKLLTETGGKAK